MDYKYIEQLLERYWACETTLEEEEILRAFFCQTEVPAHLQRYRSLFVYEHEEKRMEVLGEDFDQKILSMVDEKPAARTISLQQRLRPLFRAAAVVAIILTLGNAMQVTFDDEPNPVPEVNKTQVGPSVAAVKNDSSKVEEIVKPTIPQQETVGLQQ
ncbi:MAG: pyruvate ferredoxin oxidoreductase [Prevotella sp.]|nr:pyruvate ferredoxin oxidoreductase [Prevotella sp.]